MVAGIWAKLENKYAFVNATRVDVEEFTTSTNEVSANDFLAFAQGNDVFVKSNSNLDPNSFQLLDTDGRIITSTFIRVDEYTIQAQTQDLSTGMYIISGNQHGKMQTTKVFVQP